MCEGASKQSQNLENYTAPRLRPPVYKFLDPPLNTSKTFLLLLIRQHVSQTVHIQQAHLHELNIYKTYVNSTKVITYQHSTLHVFVQLKQNN